MAHNDDDDCFYQLMDGNKSEERRGMLTGDRKISTSELLTRSSSPGDNTIGIHIPSGD